MTNVRLVATFSIIRLSVLLLILLLEPILSDECTNTNLDHAGDTNLVELAEEDLTNDGYFRWVTQYHSSNYPNSVFVPTSSDACNGIAFHWNIATNNDANDDDENDKIHIAAIVKATGWVGIGFSETGGMRGADVVYFQSSDSSLTDAYVKDEYARPTPDAVDDWNLVRWEVTGDGYLIFEASRDLDTGDVSHDWPIVDDSSVSIQDHAFLAAWGDDDGISFHYSNRAKTVLQLFPSSGLSGGGDDRAGDGYENFLAEMAANSDGDFTLKMDEYLPLTSTLTVYEERCHSQSDISDNLQIDNGDDYRKYIIGFEFIVPENDLKYMHHMVIYGHDSSTCTFWTQMAQFPWVPGHNYISFPIGTAIAFSKSGSTDINSLRIQYHIDNADNDSGVLHGSGVKIYYTNTPPINEIGTIETGDPNLILESKLGEGYTRHDFVSPPSCFNFVNDITIISEQLHMHAKGKRMTNQVMRDGEVVHEGTVEYYDFVQVGGVMVRQEPYVFKVGDSFNTQCYYDADETDEFGLGSDDEMCIGFLLYYPKQSGYDFCAFTHEETSLTGVEDLGRIFGRDVDPPSAIPSKSPSLSPRPTTSSKPSFEPTTSPVPTISNAPSVKPTSSPSLESSSIPSASNSGFFIHGVATCIILLHGVALLNVYF